MPEDEVAPQEELDLYIEWPDQDGLENASLGDNLERLKKESQKAMKITMGVIQLMASRVSNSSQELEDKARPDEREIAFSLKLDLEGGTVVPMVAKTTAGGQFNIKFKWTFEKPNRQTVLVSENN